MADDDDPLIFLRDPRCAEFGQEIFNAFKRSRRLTIFTERSLRRVAALDGLLKDINGCSVKVLKKEIDNAQGFMSFWHQVESEQRCSLSHSDAHEINSPTQSELHDHSDYQHYTIDIAKSAILATILHILLRTRDVAIWLKAEMNITKQNENGYLLSKAVEWGLADTVELLLVSGADPQNHGIDTLDPIHGTALINRDEMHFSIAAHLFLKLIPMSHYWSHREDGYYQEPMVRARLLRKDVGPFSPEDIQKPKLTWIHVRRNNILLMMANVRIYTWVAARTLGEKFEALIRGSGDSHLTYLEPSYQSGSLEMPMERNLFSDRKPCEAEYSAIVFPYLVLTTIGQQKARRQKHEELKRDLMLDEDLLSFDHLERTLDEAYYPGLSRKALKVRNNDQVVTHNKDDFGSFDKRENGSEGVDEEAPILMVPQLWLYKLGNVVVSAYSMPQGTRYAFNEERHEDRYYDRYINEKDDWENQATPADFHLGLIITSFIDRFGKSYWDYDDGTDYAPPLDLFETRVVQLLSEVREYIEQPSGGKSSSSGLEYRRERYFIHVVSDVRSELAMIQHVLEQQERILKQFLKDCLPASEKQHLPDWTPIEASQETIQRYVRRVRKIDGDADRIEKSIQDMLNLKRTHASIRDAHSSLIVSTAVIGFTVITVVFTPLAFLTALFALKIDGFEDLQISGSDGVFHSGKIGGIFVSTEILTLVLTGIAVGLAFKYINRDQERSKKEKTVVWLESVKPRATAWMRNAKLRAAAWLKGFIPRHVSVVIWLITLIAWPKEPSRKPRAKVPDPETQLQDEDEAMSTRSGSTASWLRPCDAESCDSSDMTRSNMSGIESTSQDELQRSTTSSTESTTSSSKISDPETTQRSPQVQDKATPIRSTSAATWPVGRRTRLKYPHSRGRGRVVDSELSRQGEPQEPTSSLENPNSATAPHTPQVQDEVTSIRSV